MASTQFRQEMLSQGRAKPLLHLLVPHEPRLLKDSVSIGEDDEVRDAADLKSGGELGVCFGVHFKNKRLTCHIGSSPGDFGGRSPARAAPTGPKVHKDWDSSILDDVVKERGVYGQWLSQWRKGRLA